MDAGYVQLGVLKDGGREGRRKDGDPAGREGGGEGGREGEREGGREGTTYLKGRVIGDIPVPDAQEEEGEGGEEDVVELNGAFSEVLLPGEGVAGGTEGGRCG